MHTVSKKVLAMILLAPKPHLSIYKIAWEGQVALSSKKMSSPYLDRFLH